MVESKSLIFWRNCRSGPNALSVGAARQPFLRRVPLARASPADTGNHDDDDDHPRPDPQRRANVRKAGWIRAHPARLDRTRVPPAPTPIQAQRSHSCPRWQGRRWAPRRPAPARRQALRLPIIQRLLPMSNASASPARHPVRALMLTPTRELADQVYDNAWRATPSTPTCAAPWCSAAWT